MASHWAASLFVSSLICLHLVASCQGVAESWHSRYPFIKWASSFSAASPSPSSDGGAGSFDYIIVGGGTAGCPLAATLSRNFRVLLLERGGVPFSNVNISRMENFHLSLADLSPASASQMFVSTDGVINSRARVLGGGTSINAGFYTRANPRFVKKSGWDAQLVNESYPWVEKQIVYRPKLAQWQKALKSGLLEVGVSPDNGFTYNHVSGTKVGGSIFDEYGHRHTAAELLATANPEKLTVLIYAKVQKILFHAAGKQLRAMGVIFKDENGDRHEVVFARRHWGEVIMSCGAIGSPQLLLMSGIGPRADLEKLNISVVLDNEFVGKDMADNPHNAIFVPTKAPIEQSLIQTVGVTKMGVYIEASSGFGQSPDSIRCNHGIVSAEIGQLSTIPPKERSQEAIRAYVKRKRDLPYEAFTGGFILEKIRSPISRGELRLLNTNVDDNPSITFNYFSDPYDLRRCVDGIRMVERVVKSKNFMKFSQCDGDKVDKLLNMSVQANVNLIPRHTNDTKSLEQFCRDTVITIWHYHGGCQVGKVVDHDRKVLGINGFRVIDGSTFSSSPGTNPQATVLMMGRYMGVKMLRERLGAAAGV